MWGLRAGNGSTRRIGLGPESNGLIGYVLAARLSEVRHRSICQRQRFLVSLGNDAQARTIRGPHPRGYFVAEGDLLHDETDDVQLAIPSVRAGSSV